ncbi:MAG: exosortase, partial [Gammaproteobacteria bacterium]|nr:exosortase [Gammaproteobacteria bacterium]
MSVDLERGRDFIYKTPLILWGLIAFIGGMIVIPYFDGIAFLLKIWESKEEYSYGYMVPFICIFFIWQKNEFLEKIEFDGSWAGALLALFGVMLYVVGELSTLYLVIQYSMLIVIFGLVLSFLGRKAFRIILVPLIILMFMIPLPQFFLQEISNQLQLISSSIGVAVIRLFDISVYLEGNVIDLGTYKLQVVEACNGLRYLFPLMTLGFIAAYLYNVSIWKRAVLFLSTIPVTVLMNSFRIGMIGVMVEFWGQSMAEGFLHDFEGWVIFMACTVVLFGEMWLLNKIGKESRPLREVFGLEFPERASDNFDVRDRAIPIPFIISTLIIMGLAGSSFLMPERTEIIPSRKEFSEFPMNLEEWTGRKDRLESIYLDALK